ncbi:protein NCA1-like [Cucurbita moschata]|uniref:Protein NCA1-like n=1 Tax=Cucurbita moschata TaxID=3662 RepID=A0A6J1GY05_CUCMO|nr:protein NCA1-like [Cucurbita moschata]
MTPVCPSVKSARPDDASSRKQQGESVCPFAKSGCSDDASSRKQQSEAACPFSKSARSDDASLTKSPVEGEKGGADAASAGGKCPFGYDSQTFKIGPLSCMICQALLFECSRCVPCSHIFCKACISRFNDCPLCGADIEKIEADANLQATVDRFIEGHARIKRPQVNSDKENEEVSESKVVIYEDLSMERGAFLIQQAMRAFRAQNIGSAKSRLTVCVEDIRDQLERMGNSSELCSQLGAVLGTLGDCCRAAGDASSAIIHFEESVEFLSKLPEKTREIIQTLSVSLNKIGDLKYYEGDLQAARSYYLRSLNVRQDWSKHHPDDPAQILDVAVSLAKVADVDSGLGNEDMAVDRFQEGIKLLESLTLNSENPGLEQRRQSVLKFLEGQFAERQKPNRSSC